MEVLSIATYLFSFLFYLFATIFLPKNDKSCNDKIGLFSLSALFFLSVGFLSNLCLISKHFFTTHRLPLTNTPETLLSIITIIVFIFLILEYSERAGSAFFGKFRHIKVIGMLISLISTVGLIAAFYLLKRPSMPLLPALQSKWLVFHVSSCIIAYCFFTISFITAIIHLFKKDSKLNSTSMLNLLTHRCICVGFFFLTLGIILGSLWGKAAWGHWWNWDPKETWALITWLIYGSYFYGRLWGTLSEKKLSYIAIVGFLSCLFTYLGVNFLLKGLHSYA